jgi:hypothetical protein
LPSELIPWIDSAGKSSPKIIFKGVSGEFNVFFSREKQSIDAFQSFQFKKNTID